MGRWKKRKGTWKGGEGKRGGKKTESDSVFIQKVRTIPAPTGGVGDVSEKEHQNLNNRSP